MLSAHMIRAWQLVVIGFATGCRQPAAIRPMAPAPDAAHASVRAPESTARPDPTAATAPPAATAPTPSIAPTASPDVDARDSDGWTPLHHAAQRGNLERIEELIRRGANLEIALVKTYPGATPLVTALEFSQPEAAKLLLDRGASTAERVGRVALTLAARCGAVDVIEALLARGVSVKGTTALHAAARSGGSKAVACLIGAGADANQPLPDDHNFTPLMIACAENQLDASRVLLAAGARVNDRDDGGSTPLHWAVYAARPREIHRYGPTGPHTTQWIPRADAPLVELLIDHHAALQAIDGEHNTPLHQAAMMNARAAAALLVAAGADRTARNRQGKTPYDLAKDRSNSVEELLRSSGGPAKSPH
jgi:ankyrin repeat protein